MMRLLKLFVTASLLVTLAACKNFAFPGVHKIDIQQGNIVTQKMVDQLQPGMTKPQVRFILGTPLISDTFNENRWDYFYSMDDRKNPKQSKRISVFFENEVLVRFTGDFAPTGSKPGDDQPLTE